MTVEGKGFGGYERITVTFVDSGAGKTLLGNFNADAKGHLANTQVAIPLGATVGQQTIVIVGTWSHQKGKAKFTVT